MTGTKKPAKERAFCSGLGYPSITARL